MKVRVKREMPFINVGQTIEIVDGMISDPVEAVCYLYDTKQTKRLIKDGWLEVVPERKTLVEKFIDKIPLVDKNPLYNSISMSNMRELSKLAIDHVLELMDEGDKAWNLLSNEEIGKLMSKTDNGKLYFKFLRQYIEREGET